MLLKLAMSLYEPLLDLQHVHDYLQCQAGLVGSPQQDGLVGQPEGDGAQVSWERGLVGIYSLN